MLDNLARKLDFKKENTIQSNRLSYEDLKTSLLIYSDSNYEDSQWLLNKYHPDRNVNAREKTIYFKKLSGEIINEAKEYAILCLLNKQSTTTINSKMYAIADFCNHCSIEKIDDIEKKNIESFYHYNFNKELKIKTKLITWARLVDFFNTLGYLDIVSIFNSYTLPNAPKQEKDDAKYIPDEIVRQLDVIFKVEKNIPIQYKTIYWTLRLIPNRISEVLSMTTECLKQVNEDVYTITIPTTKQAGPYNTGSLKMIQILYSDMGKFYIDLVKEMLKYRKKIDKETKDNFLFYSPTYEYTKEKVNIHKKKNIILNRDRVITFFNKVICKNNITYDGHIFKLTTHQFRHNAITDRINSGYFREIDLLSLTAHHSTSMIEKAYLHRNVEEVSTGPVVFKGRVINTDNPKKIEKLLERPYAFEIHNLGICSDSRDCAKDKFSCYRCKYIVPDVKNLPYFNQQLNEWSKKRHLAIQTGNVSYQELCEDRMDALQTIINRINDAIEKEENKNANK